MGLDSVRRRKEQANIPKLAQNWGHQHNNNNNKKRQVQIKSKELSSTIATYFKEISFCFLVLFPSKRTSQNHYEMKKKKMARVAGGGEGGVLSKET